MIKQVSLRDGRVTILTGQDDAFSEYDVGWLDTTHITFNIQEWPVVGKGSSSWTKHFDHIIVDLNTGKRTIIPESMELAQSPDGRYRVTCTGYPYYSSCGYRVEDLITGVQWQGTLGMSWVAMWSPDNRHFLFGVVDNPNDPTGQLAVADATTGEEKVITPADKTVLSTSWSPDGQTIAFAQCNIDEVGKTANCALWLMNQDGSNARLIPSQQSFEAYDLAWTPDGSRLVFSADDTIWSIRVNGTDLRPIASKAHNFQIRCEP